MSSLSDVESRRYRRLDWGLPSTLGTLPSCTEICYNLKIIDLLQQVALLKNRLCTKALILNAGLVLLPEHAAAFSVLGNLRVGGYTRAVEFEETSNGDATNDEQVLSAQLKMDITDFDSQNDAFVIDLRDKIDSYGRLDTQNLSLDTYNRFQVRELAFKRPWEDNKFYFTLGRFSLAEANILDNDGGEFGYRFSKQSRLGLFGGMAPKDVITPYYVTPNTDSVNNAQAGLYYSYEKKNGLERSLYTNNALAMGPTYNLTDKKSHTYFYHMAIWNMTAQNRISSYLQQDFVPKAGLRRASLSHSFYNPKFETSLSLIQTNTEDYLIQQDILDSLAPSGEQQLRFDLRHRIFAFLNFDYLLAFSKREADGKAQSEYALGLIVPKLLSNSGSARAQYGIRNNYFSKDRYFRVGYDFWNKFFSASLMHTVIDMEYEDTGLKNTRQVSTVDGGFFLNERVRASVAYQREQDAVLSASALFLMVGYRFGSGPAAPIRTRPAPFEEI